MSSGILISQAVVGGVHWLQSRLNVLPLVIAGVAATRVRRAVRGSDGPAERVQ